MSGNAVFTTPRSTIYLIFLDVETLLARGIAVLIQNRGSAASDAAKTAILKPLLGYCEKLHAAGRGTRGMCTLRPLNGGFQGGGAVRVLWRMLPHAENGSISCTHTTSPNSRIVAATDVCIAPLYSTYPHLTQRQLKTRLASASSPVFPAHSPNLSLFGTGTGLQAPPLDRERAYETANGAQTRLVTQ